LGEIENDGEGSEFAGGILPLGDYYKRRGTTVIETHFFPNPPYVPVRIGLSFEHAGNDAGTLALVTKEPVSYTNWWGSLPTHLNGEDFVRIPPQERKQKMNMNNNAGMIRKFAVVVCSGWLVTVSMLSLAGASDASTEGKPRTLPFAFSVAKKGEGNFFRGDYIDYPLSQVVVKGEVWSFHTTAAYANPTPIIRYKGPDFEHLTRQADGMLRSSEPDVSCHFGCGMWFDDSTGTLYALIHSEYDGNVLKRDKLWGQGAAWCRKKTRMATSKDMGLTWSDPRDVLTACLPNPGDWAKYSGRDFEMGPADFDLYADTRGGYFYATCWNGFVAKKGPLNKFGTYVEAARCAIADKMAPGKWRKYRDGSWTEPGLGGKASRVMEPSIYGRTVYNDWLRRYLRVGTNAHFVDTRFPGPGLSDGSVYILACTDLGKQDWTPLAKLLDQPENTLGGFSVADGHGKDFTSCGETFRVYNYWTSSPVRIFEVALREGTMPATPFSPYGAYLYEPHPESGDPTDSRRTTIVGCDSPEMRYSGSGWMVEKNAGYFRGVVKASSTAGDSVQLSFKGGSIYWRAVFSRDAGKADVYLDKRQEAVIDCCSGDRKPNMFQFGFIRTGLDPSAIHVIRIMVRNDRNPNSTGNIIRHMGFEHGEDVSSDAH
jgi:hypothetical protein